MNRYPKTPLLTPEEELHLARAYCKSGDQATFKTLVEANTRLVLSHVREFLRYPNVDGSDVIQEGFVGLLIAIRKFNPERGVRLATYATFWIRARMLDHVIRTYGPVRIGTTRGCRKVFFNLGWARQMLDAEQDDPDAIARVLGVRTAEVEEMIPRMGANRDLSLDADTWSREAASLASENSPEETMASAEEAANLHARLEAGLRDLDARAEAILRARHLLEKPMTLRKLGEEHGISRERVRQIEKQTITKLRRAAGAGTA